MKKLLLLFLLLTAFTYSQKYKVTFDVTVKNLPDTSAVFITGNQPEFGNWNPSFQKLNKESGNKWTVTLEFEKGTYLEYKFTLGDWDYEALNLEGNIPGNSKLTVNNDTALSSFVKDWGLKGHLVKGQITGTVKYHLHMTGKNLKPRDIIVWLPPGYDLEKSKRYPVLYAHDGQNMFDPNTSAWGTDWQLDETADSLIRQNKIEEIIIVGIYNTPDRSAEYLAGDTSVIYMNFIVNELKPFIDKNYRTLTDRNNTASIGSSAGGTISFLLLMMRNDIFGKAACISPALKLKEKDYVYPYRLISLHGSIKLYMDAGGVGLDSLLIPGITDMMQDLKSRGFKEEKEYTFYFDKQGEHKESSWAKRLWRPLMFLFSRE